MECEHHVTLHMEGNIWGNVVYTLVFIMCIGRLTEGSKQRPPLFSDLVYYEPVYYDQTDLLNRHKQVRRTTSGHMTVDLQFDAYGRTFSMHLNRDTSTFHHDVIIETSHVSLPYDARMTYSGYLIEEPSRIHGLITHMGHFEGKIYTDTETYFVERTETSKENEDSFHTIIYKLSDVISDRNVTSCAHSQILNKQKAMHTSGEFESLDKPIDNIGSLTSYYSDQRADDKQRKSRSDKRDRRAAGVKNTCELYIQADHMFYERYGNIETVIEKLTEHVQAANVIFNELDFDSSGSPDNIGFIVKKIKIWDDPTADGYKYPDTYAVDYLLDLFSQDNFNDFCLSYLFTNRDFSSGVLGLAWIGDTELSGGICQIHGLVNDVGMSLNTGLVTILNYGMEVSSAVSHVTFAHELGHSFGSNHDPEDDSTCTPGGLYGNYIMYARATSGWLPNNDKMSSCSVEQMHTVISLKGTSSTGCFIDYTGEICGNRVVEGNEECDCGWTEECTETCCYPQTLGSPAPGQIPCTRKSSAECSPSEGPCCGTDCRYSSGDVVCQTETDCRYEGTCDGTGSSCPQSDPKDNSTSCGDSQDLLVCYNGECSGSVCLAHGRVACQCEGEEAGTWREERLCHVCCVNNGACVSSYDLPDVPDGMVMPGTPCNNFRGYCDVLRVCRSVDPSGPLSNLKSLFLSEETWDDVGDFLRERWYVPLCAGIGIVLIMSIIIKVYIKKRGENKKRQRQLSRVQPVYQNTNFRRKTNQVYPTGFI